MMGVLVDVGENLGDLSLIDKPWKPLVFFVVSSNKKVTVKINGLMENEILTKFLVFPYKNLEVKALYALILTA